MINHVICCFPSSNSSGTTGMPCVHLESAHLWQNAETYRKEKLEHPGRHQQVSFEGAIGQALRKVLHKVVDCVCDCRYPKLSHTTFSGRRFSASLHLGFLTCVLYGSL